MNRLRFLRLVTVTVVAAMFTSCGGLNTMLKDAPEVTYSVSPNPLEMHADSVEITVTGQYPAKFFNKKAVMEVTPVLKWDGGEKTFATQTLQGEAVEANATIISFETGGSFNYTAKIPYSDEMDISELVVRVKATIKEKSVEFPEIKLADGVISTPKLVHLTAQDIEAMHQFKRIENLTESADIHFVINQATVRSSELKEADVKNLESVIDEAKDADNMEFKGVKIAAYASPDGAEDLNTRLAEKRKVAAQNYLSKELKSVDAAKEDGFVSAESTPEDWDGFKTLMAVSDIQDKEQILRVLEINSDPELREKEIKKLSQVYEEIAEKVLPELRRSKLNVNIDKIGKSDSLLIVLSQADTIVDTLTVEEYLKAATLVIAPEKKAKILSTASEIYTDDWRVYNNLGCALYAADDYKGAEEAFMKADELSEGNTICKNNLGTVAFATGDTEKALEYFELAAGAGKAVSQNQGMIKIKTGDYQGAVDLYGSDESFNAALAKLLNGDIDGALATITASEDPDDALGYYLKAVIGARTSNTDLLFTNLKTAISKESKLAEKAKKDMEFAKYFEDDTFKSIVQ